MSTNPRSIRARQSKIASREVGIPALSLAFDASTGATKAQPNPTVVDEPQCCSVLFMRPTVVLLLPLTIRTVFSS